MNLPIKAKAPRAKRAPAIANDADTAETAAKVAKVRAPKVSPQGDTEKQVSPQGDTEKQVSPQGDTEKQVSPQGDTEKQVSPQGDTVAKVAKAKVAKTKAAKVAPSADTASRDLDKPTSAFADDVKTVVATPPAQTLNLDISDNRKTLSISRSAEALELRERLQKVLATSGLGARRGLEERILKGEITLNGAVPELGSQVKVGDRIGVDERVFVVKMQEGDFGRILLYNKPDGEVTTRHDPEGRKTVFEVLPRLRGSRWIAVGRLDINTQGLLVFTTNGELAQKLTHPENELEREYLCRVHGEVTEEIVAKLLAGVALEDGPAAVTLIESMDSAGGSNEWWRVVIKEGRNREIRRLWEAVGLQVSRLKRASFGPFTLPKGLNRGQLAELDAADTQKVCVEMGISQNPSQLIAEDEAASRLRRNRVAGEGVEGKKRFVAAGKGKAEAFWTGERGYGGAGSRPMRAGGGEFDLGASTGSERPRDGRAKRGKGMMRGKPGAGRTPFVGPMGMSSFDANIQNLNGPNTGGLNTGGPNSRGTNSRGPRGGRAPGAPGANPTTGPRNDRRGQRRGPNPNAPMLDQDGAPVLNSDGTPRFMPRAENAQPRNNRRRGRSGPRPDGANRPPRPEGEARGPRPERGNDPNTSARDAGAPARNANDRHGGRGRDRGPDRDRGSRDRGDPNRQTGENRIADVGNRIGESVGRKRVGFMRGALGTAETYDARSIHADSEDFGNRIGGAQPRQPRADFRGGNPGNPGNSGNRGPRSFSGPMDNAHPHTQDANRPEIDGNSARPTGGNSGGRNAQGESGQNHSHSPNQNPRNVNSRNRNRGRGDRRPIENTGSAENTRPNAQPNGAPQSNREQLNREARPAREPRPQREPRPPALDANGAPIARAPNDGRPPRNRNRNRRRGPRPDGGAPSTPQSAPPSAGNE